MKNKKSLILITALLFAQNIATIAQEPERVKVVSEPADFNRVELGFRFMPTVSSFRMEGVGDNTIESKATLGYGMGGFLGLNLSNHVGISGELLYFSLSQKFKDEELGRTIKVPYINIPILLSFSTGKSHRST